jgi:hypothetical protein
LASLGLNGAHLAAMICIILNEQMQKKKKWTNINKTKFEVNKGVQIFKTIAGF